MRWNCPHCQATLIAPAEVETKKKTYVRCASCGGASLLHRSAAILEAARARRLEQIARQEERKARLEAEARIEAATAKAREAMNDAVTAAARATALAAENATNPFIQAPPRASVAVDPNGATTVAVPAPVSAMSASPAAAAAAPAPAPRVTPPPFTPPARAVPATYAKPPAFLMAASAAPARFDSVIDVSEWDDDTMVEVHCGTITENAEISSEPIVAPTQPAPTASVPAPEKTTKLKARISAVAASNAPVWIAAALALASGIYLIAEARRALTPPAATIEASASR